MGRKGLAPGSRIYESQKVYIVVRSEVNEATGCWNWQKAQNGVGYGVAGVKRWGTRYAHRIAYEAWKGSIPEGLDLDHLCRNRNCVNPDHMEAVTRRENVLRGQGQPAENARKTHCIHGHEYTDENTSEVMLANGQLGRRCRTCHNMRRRKQAVPQHG